jgi:tRNA threonylcarbamoyladenosine biosynthesis protein TsaB
MTSGPLLALDTATSATAVALHVGPGRPILEARDDPPPGSRPNHATRLMPLIAEVLERGGIGLGELELIAVGVGPGTFTGLRIGIATARALARAHGIPLAGISTLQSLAVAGALAAPSASAAADAVVAVLDARRGEVFAAAWRPAEVAAADSALLPPQALTPETLTEIVAATGLQTLAVGDGAVRFSEVLEHSGALIPENSELHRVMATNHCRLARSLGLMGSQPEEIGPEYLRLPDAELALRAGRDR